MNEHIKEKLFLQLEDDDATEDNRHPRCSHGPTVLFYRESQMPKDGYYACSAYRNPKLCNFRMDHNKWKVDDLKRLSEIREYPKAIKEKDPDPTKHIEPLSQDDVHAQYFFDEKALLFLAEQIRLLKIKVICMGAPRLHFHLKRIQDVQSFLLDFDERFSSYLNPQEFCLYNMCNNHFFYSREPFELFLKCNNNERVLIVTDPPFGCRTELIAHTLRSMKHLHNRINHLPLPTPLPIFWVYPYYMANYIKHDMPELQMCDYKLNYTNHNRYTNVGPTCRSYGSPVRVFTNVPLGLLQLPMEEGYKYCTKCNRFTAAENSHCERCNNCSSQNGQTYRHCSNCDLCVKPNYVHCAKCRRCSQREGHSCELYQSKQRCWICGQLGHIETSCRLLQHFRKSGKRKNLLKQNGCLICSRKDHSERSCKQRYKFLKESQFMGETKIQLRSDLR